MRLIKSLFLLVIIYPFCIYAEPGAQKQVVGAIEIIEIEESGLKFKARVDTGAQTCSIHAEDIQVDGRGDPVGKPVTFRVVNEKGQFRIVESRVASVVTVKTSEGKELRYKVPLTIKWKSTRKTVLVTLNDRRSMSYPFLLGRNWLQNDFLVDVELNGDD